LRDLAYEGGIDMLLCLSPDRLARQYVYQCLLLEEFQRWGVRVQFIQQPDLEDTPQNQLLLGVQGQFAEYERAVMRERMRRGRLYRLRQGERCFHQAPFGYRYIPVKEPHGGRWEIDTQEAAVVQQIFAWYTQASWSLKKIATQLNETGVPVRRQGGRWNAGRISVILVSRPMLEKRTIIDTAPVPKVSDGARNRAGVAWWHPTKSCVPQRSGLRWTPLRSSHQKSGSEPRTNVCTTNVFPSATITNSSTCCVAY